MPDFSAQLSSEFLGPRIPELETVCVAGNREQPAVGRYRKVRDGGAVRPVVLGSVVPFCSRLLIRAVDFQGLSGIEAQVPHKY